MENSKYENLEKILVNDLHQALGCTEPIAIALCAAKAASILGKTPSKIILYCSKNIIKNANSVTVPNSNGLNGIEAATILGIVGGNSDKNLRVLEDITQDDIKNTKKLIDQNIFSLNLSTEPNLLYIKCELYSGNDVVSVEIKDSHSNITKITKNKDIVFEASSENVEKINEIDTSVLSVDNIIDFADNVILENYPELTNKLDMQIACNTAISKEGLSGKYGAGIGYLIIENSSNSDIKSMVKGATSAASDARMGGCGLPVVINSGSGNQGITSSLPVITYAQELGLSKEKLYRGLIVSNLLNIHQKRFVGKLSAFCGVVSASASSGSGIAYLMGLNKKQIKNVITNTLVTSGGIVCDGAKPSCAAKIAVALDNAMLSIDMAKSDISFETGDGIVGKDVETTIRNIGRMAAIGMKGTDEEILNIMIGK